ncbi:phosphodiester glycosidase family protein [bacterium]|nr:phosphodiester glycosidase family protein [bacterium]
MRNTINEASFDGMLAQIQDFDRQVVKAKPTPKPTPVPQSNSQEALASTPINNTSPGSGYSSQVVEVDGQRFTVKIVAADMGSTKVVVDTATDGECRENCPVLSLGQYVARSGAFAGINGSFFMPYDNTNSFDGYVKNKNGTCINPNSDGWRAIFNVGNMSFTAGSEWGCQGDEGGIGNYPLLVYGGTARGEHSDPKISATKSARSFVGNKGSTAYIGVVHNSTSLEAGKVLQTMGLDNALGLDAGGSTALWAAGGYKVGPNRGLPNAILFVAR